MEEPKAGVLFLSKLFMRSRAFQIQPRRFLAEVLYFVQFQNFEPWDQFLHNIQLILIFIPHPLQLLP